MAVHELPEELGPYSTIVCGRNLIALRNLQHNGLHFLRLPPVMSQKPIERWSIPPLPFRLKAFAVYLLDGIIAATEGKER